MPKNTRPDIQVLEDRVVRLKSQIEDYKDLRLYKATKQRLSKVCSELEECISILNSVIGEGISSISVNPDSRYSSDDTYMEFSIDSDNSTDLGDRLVINAGPNKQYSPKEIVRIYSQHMQECADTVGCASGIIQVNQFCQLLNSWYQTRFTPKDVARNPKFLFKVDKIPEWIDLLFLAGGNALHKGIFQDFLADMRSWISDLNTDRDQTWALPFSVTQLQQSRPACYTKEAIVLEKILKPSLFDKSFYIHNMHTLEQSYSEAFGTAKSDLDLEKILQHCPKLIVTSSFDANNYKTEN